MEPRLFIGLELASDTAPEWLAWQHAIDFVFENYNSFDRFLSLPATSPLRSSEDVQKCLNALDNDTDFVITMTPAHRNPWFNMVTSDLNQRVKLVAGSGQIKRRQDALPCYDVGTVVCVTSRIYTQFLEYVGWCRRRC